MFVSFVNLSLSFLCVSLTSPLGEALFYFQSPWRRFQYTVERGGERGRERRGEVAREPVFPTLSSGQPLQSLYSDLCEAWGGCSQVYLWIPVSGVYTSYIDSEGDVFCVFICSEGKCISHLICDLGTYTVAYGTMEPRLFAMERHGN